MASVFPPENRWQQIDRLFQAALECPEAELESFLKSACSGDPDLGREVRALLDRAPQAELLIGESAVTFAGPLLTGLDRDAAALPGSAGPGSQLGSYRLLEEIGRGGMGAVFRAERADAQFEKQVAIKLVKRGMDTDEVLRRFRYERQILATLEHPNIARLLDGGVSPDGRPYLVMEYIEGRPITEYCEQHAIGIEQRLALFQTVCRAVQYAHQNLVVHRDIKPSNIMVTSSGDVKLLDFGIAKVLYESAVPEAPETSTGMRLLTPDYAAP